MSSAPVIISAAAIRSAPAISIVMPTFNRLARLKKVIEGLTQQTLGQAFEIIVVSDGSTDGTNAYLDDVAVDLAAVGIFVRAEVQHNQGPAAARNRGIALATAPLVLFLDDDVVPSASLLAQHLAAHERLGDAVVVIGTMSTPPDHEMSSWVSWEQVMLYKQYDAMISGRWAATARQFYTGNASVGRKYLLASGGFDTAFRRAEDVELAYRLARSGLRFVFVPDAVGFHYAERSFDSWLANATAYGRNDVIFARDRGQDWLLPVLRKEFTRRDLLTRTLTQLCLRTPGLHRAAIPVLKRLVWLSGSLGLHSVNRKALSGAFNLCYYLGLSNELGGWRVFLEHGVDVDVKQ